MNVILFGATGMVGQAVLRECLRDDSVKNVLTIGRSSAAQTHSKLREIILKDLFEFDSFNVTDLHDYDACFFCLGVSSAGMNEADYTHLTYDLTIGWAKTLAHVNSTMTFIYVSGAGTGGKSMWAQVKGRTEQALLELFPNSYMFRLAMLQPRNGEVSKTRWTRISYTLFWPLLPLVRLVWPAGVITSEELGRAMLRVGQHGAPKRVLENQDMRALGES